MTKPLLALSLLIAACTAAPAPTIPGPPPEPDRPKIPYGLSLDEEVRALMLEDRRELDAPLVEAWLRHENPLHRRRAALMLARIGPATFIDANGNGEKDGNETTVSADIHGEPP